MSLPRVLACGLLACVISTTHAATFVVGTSGTLRIDIPQSWTTTGQRLDNVGVDLRFQPGDSEGPQICFTIIVPPDGKTLDRTEAGNLLREIAGQLAAGSANVEAAIKEKDMADGFAVYASIPTAAADQSPDPDSWKSSTPCVMVLGGKVVISATIFADDTAAADFARSLDVLWSTRFEPRQ